MIKALEAFGIQLSNPPYSGEVAGALNPRKNLLAKAPCRAQALVDQHPSFDTAPNNQYSNPEFKTRFTNDCHSICRVTTCHF